MLTQKRNSKEMECQDQKIFFKKLIFSKRKVAEKQTKEFLKT